MVDRITIIGSLACLFVAVATPAASQVLDRPTSPPRFSAAGIVDARLGAIRDVLQTYGPRSAYFGSVGLDQTRLDGTAAMLRFDGPLTLGELADLRAAGVEFFVDPRGLPLRVGPVYGAFVRWEALDALGKHPRLAFAEASWHPKLEQPLEVTGVEVGAAQNVRMPDVGFDGTGAVIGDIDSGVDVLHPHFFFADGGAFDWIDVNDDGVFTRGVDAVDYDRDGTPGRNEVLRVLDGASTDLFTRQTRNDDGVLDPRFDWLYADRNNDAERNAGPDEGFTEFDPGYGEPLFIADDANRNGLLEPNERLILLRTSKIQRFVTTPRTWVRGVDLIEAARLPQLDNAMHGTGVASILVGGQPRIHERFGVAPGAELVMYASHLGTNDGFDDTPQLRDLQDAVAAELDVVVHEWTNPYTAPHDGSGNFEAAMDAARSAGVVQVNPLGNLNLSQKHREVDVAAGAIEDFTFVVDGGFQWGATRYPYTVVYASVFWRGEQLPTFELVRPTGESTALPVDNTTSFSFGGEAVQSVYNRSMRGTHHLIVTLWNPDNQTSVSVGDWRIRISDTTVDDRFVARVADYYSGWSVGVRWADPTRDLGTLVYPSTADSAIGVAAYGGRHEQAQEGTLPGQLRGYSGRGPRLDGARGVDIAAPDDPYAALVASPAYLDAGYGRSWFTVFGGTSGAGPHVAGTVALLRGREPNLSSQEVEERLFGSARQDAMTSVGLPDEAWGHGKLATFATLRGVAPPVVNRRPSVETITEEDGVIRAIASDPDDDPLSYRWDLDYDGEWDTNWSSDSFLDLGDAPRDGLIRLEVADSHGSTSGAVYENPRAEPEELPDAGSVDAQRPPLVIPIEPRRGCGGCSSGAADESSAVWLLAAGAIVMGARRRRRTRTRRNTSTYMPT